MAELTWQAAAAANILEARKRKGRTLGRKSRSGCLTCKTRRIKCDETKPGCRKCAEAGRACSYADSTSPKDNNKTSRSLIGQQLSQTLGLRDDEIRTFDYFLSWTAPRMAGALDKDFWCGQVLQVAQSEPIVLDALLAISTLYEHPQFMKSFYPPGRDRETSTDPKYQNGVINITHPAMSKPPIDEHHADALIYYNRAMSRFKDRVETGKATPLLALLTCALFICTEVIRDNVFGALVLFTQGMKLLNEFEPDNGADDALYMNLKLMFARLGLQTALFGHSGRVNIPPELTNVDVENGFANLSNARTSLYALTTDVHDCIRDASEFRSGPGTHLPPTDFVTDYPNEAVQPDEVMTSSDGVTRLYYGCVDDETAASQVSRAWNDLPPRTTLTTRSLPWYSPSDEILDRQIRLQQRLAQWLEAFKKSPFSRNEDETTSTLLMHYNLFNIWLNCCLSPFETAFDQFATDFEEVLRLADIFTRCKADRPTFTLEVGVVPHLYFAATKCRVPSMRRRAVDLMHKAPLKEAMHGATSVAEFVNCIIAIEEEDLQSSPIPSVSSRNASQSPPIDDTVLPAEQNRIQHLEILKNKPANRFEIRVTRHSYDATGQRIKSVMDYPI